MITKKKLIDYLLKEGGKPDNMTWFDLGVKFKIKPTDHKRAKTDSDYRKRSIETITRKTWEKHLKQKNELELTKEIYRHGSLEWETFKKSIDDDTVLDLTNMDLQAITTNPYGGAWFKYKKVEGFSEEDITWIAGQIKGKRYKVGTRKGTGTICVDIADIHAGMLHFFNHETIRKPEFNIQAVDHYLQQIVSIINSYRASEVHLFFPGDLAESVSGKNHSDTWKHIHKFRNNVAIVVYKLLKNFILSVKNVKACYFVEGNHDRLTPQFEGNTRRGLSEVVSYFLKENVLDVEIHYHPLMIVQNIDGLIHMCTHGDWKPWKNIVGRKKVDNYGEFLFKYGKGNTKFHLLKTAHFHNFTILQQNYNFIHYQCPAISTGSFYETAIGGYEGIPGVLVSYAENEFPRLDFRPLSLYDNRQNESDLMVPFLTD